MFVIGTFIVVVYFRMCQYNSKKYLKRKLFMNILFSIYVCMCKRIYLFIYLFNPLNNYTHVNIVQSLLNGISIATKIIMHIRPANWNITQNIFMYIWSKSRGAYNENVYLQASNVTTSKTFTIYNIYTRMISM